MKQRVDDPRNPAWWAVFAFYEGILEGFLEDAPLLPDVKQREDIIASLRRCRSLLMKIEDSVMSLSSEPPF
jgi:hypothetical protein